MKVREYLKKLQKYSQVTFIKAKSVKDEATRFYHCEYRTTPLACVYEWENATVNDFIILNDKQPSITWLSGADWNIDISQGHARCLLVISPEDFELRYPNKEQRESMEKYIEGKLDFH